MIEIAILQFKNFFRLISLEFQTFPVKITSRLGLVSEDKHFQHQILPFKIHFI